jgi:hypothetical protein
MERTEYHQVPRIRNVLVHGHEAGVDIRLFGEGATSLSPNLLAIVEEGVCKGGGDGRKREPVGDGKGRGKEERAVFLVSLQVEGGIRVDDLRDIVFVPRVIERVRRHDGKVSTVPSVGVLQTPMISNVKKKKRQGDLT